MVEGTHKIREPRGRFKLTAEHLFFAGWVLWLAALLWWRPEPVITFADAPSAKTTQAGYSLFYELVATQSQGARRVLSAPDDFPQDVGVLVLLSPREAVPQRDIEELLDWVKQGHTLIVGYPLKIKSAAGTEPAEAGLLGCSLVSLGEAALSNLAYTGSAQEASRQVPSFPFSVVSVFDVDSCDAVSLLSDETNDPVAVRGPLEEGVLIELANADLLSNSAIGWKTTHLWAAALMDEGGRDKVWAFDETYHGIKPEPQLVRLLGAGRWRNVFLNVVLLLLVGYWWRSRRLGVTLPRTYRVVAREVATLIDDIGAFYLRSGKSLWALDRSVEHLSRSLKERGTNPKARAEAEEIVAQARTALQAGGNHLSEHLPLLVALARAEQGLGRSALTRVSQARSKTQAGNKRKAK